MAEEIKCTISDPKTGKSYTKSVDATALLGRKVRDVVSGTLFGLTGYELKICGGSDKSGFPMRPELNTAERKKLLVQRSIGVRKTGGKGIFKRKTVRGNTVSPAIAQINLAVAKAGTKSIEELLGPPAEKK